MSVPVAELNPKSLEGAKRQFVELMARPSS